jgi:hypothetical protein
MATSQAISIAGIIKACLLPILKELYFYCFTFSISYLFTQVFAFTLSLHLFVFMLIIFIFEKLNYFFVSNTKLTIILNFRFFKHFLKHLSYYCFKIQFSLRLLLFTAFVLV